ncbi:MAG: dTDP-glucose 4,6-dehydratase 2 [Pseudomonadales bacterium]|nr:dTDP-glucose 4,6-dehydratase 2 [Pseudomonadales bacterium]
MTRRLLVTGAAGFIGANFCHYWHATHPADRIVAYDALTYAGNRANLGALDESPRFRFVHADIADTARVAALLREEAIDTIVHFAAESHVDRSIDGPDAFIATNVVGTHSLLKAAREVWMGGSEPVPHRFHHVSTDEVFGSLGPADPAFTETLAYAPNSPYSASKAASDHLVRAYLHTYGLQVTTSNCSNNYGPWHFPEKLIPLCIVNLLQGRELPVYGDGRNVRDWLYVEDHCRGIERVLERGVVGETYNIGGNNEWANIDIVNLLCDLVDEFFAADTALAARFPSAAPARGAASRSLIAFVRDRPGHDRRYAIDAGKVTRELGYAPVESFETGIRKTLAWYLANEPWWRAILDGSYRN